MRIIDLTAENESAVQQAAALLVELLPEGWPTMEAALQEVRESLAPGRISRIALEGEAVLGWVGGLERYRGHVWELHPLVVRRERQRQGIGRALVADLEGRVRERGGNTLFVGADDERGETSLAGIDLYPDPLEHVRRIRNVSGHAYEFYQKLGYVIVGVVPDANGFGKPDIYLAKRIAPPKE
ncbi:MAG: aminoglycoside 6'-acetyltransferase [Chloroflexi bacterium RBG_16_68_14]|nr:MAG: aminoglycoside 6'-acetyltransferase [Chloroflexi bacterium RBG_16_68_14]